MHVELTSWDCSLVLKRSGFYGHTQCRLDIQYTIHTVPMTICDAKPQDSRSAWDVVDSEEGGYMTLNLLDLFISQLEIVCTLFSSFFAFFPMATSWPLSSQNSKRYAQSEK